MECKICQNQTKKLFNAKVLYKYDVDYFQCQTCGFGQTEKPYWLDEAYISSMNLSDTGVMYRCERMSKITTSLLFLFFKMKGKFLDYAGGFGVFTRQMHESREKKRVKKAPVETCASLALAKNLQGLGEMHVRIRQGEEAPDEKPGM